VVNEGHVMHSCVHNKLFQQTLHKISSNFFFGFHRALWALVSACCPYFIMGDGTVRFRPCFIQTLKKLGEP